MHFTVNFFSSVIHFLLDFEEKEMRRMPNVIAGFPHRDIKDVSHWKQPREDKRMHEKLHCAWRLRMQLWMWCTKISNTKTHKTRILSSINGDGLLDGPIVLSHCGFSSCDVLLEIEIWVVGSWYLLQISYWKSIILDFLVVGTIFEFTYQFPLTVQNPFQCHILVVQY
jgi:hypothetical protein